MKPGRAFRGTTGLSACVGCAFAASVSAQVTSTFAPPVMPPFLPSGSWDDPDDWDTANFPDNGQPNAGDTYNAINRAGTAFVNGDFTIEDLTLGTDGTNDGNLSPSGPTGTRRSLTVNGTFNWEAGRISGELDVTVLGGIVIDTPETKQLSTSQLLSDPPQFLVPNLNHGGTGTWSDGNVTGQIVVGPGLNQAPMFNNLTGATLTTTAAGRRFTPRFNNAGTLNVDVGAGEDIRIERLFNDGTVNVISGTLDVQEAITQGDQTRISNGDFVISPGATLLLNNHQVLAGGSITGGGDVELSGFVASERVDVFGGFAVGGTTTVLGDVTLPNDATTSQLVLDGDDPNRVIGGGFSSGTQLDGDITVSGLTRWVAGGYDGQGTIHANGGVSFESTGGDDYVLFGGTTLNIGADSTYDGGEPILVEDDAALNILPGVTFAVTGSAGLGSTENGDRGLITNDGVMTFAGGGSSFSTEIRNNGLIVVNADATLSRSSLSTTDGNLSQAPDAEIRVLGGNLRTLSRGPGITPGGTITGSGSISTNAFGGGTVLSPGLDPSVGSPIGVWEGEFLTLLDDATVVFDLAGTDPSEYDRIFNDDTGIFADPGDITLDGDLVLRFAAGFESLVTMADTFAIFEAPEDIDGAFNNVAAGARLLTADGSGSFVVNYGPTSPFGDNRVVLSDYEVIPEPAAGLLLLTLGFSKRRRR